jgi:hypothetical protein
MDLFDLRPILEEHQRRRMTEAHEERLAASVAFRWIRLVRRTRRTRHSGATSSPHLPACGGGDPGCRGLSASS